jgi:HTH-type transcriptional regulator, sugar sensing transcriptional regulator
MRDKGGNKMPQKLIENLQKLGFTVNEAKIYATLVLLKQARASEIAENSGVPRAKIYRTLRKMEKKGYVRIIEGEPTLFCCVQPEELIFMIKTDFMLSLNEIAVELNALDPAVNSFSHVTSQKIKARF